MEAPLGTWTCEALEEMATFCRSPVACPCEDRGAPAHTERRGQRLCRYEVVIDRGRCLVQERAAFVRLLLEVHACLCFPALRGHRLLLADVKRRFGL
jgi:hypothetical protein